VLVLQDWTLFLKQNLEAFIWLLALVLLAFMPVDATDTSLCMFHQLGIESCPGCGLGHSISAALHGDLVLSIDGHPLGIIAVVLLIFRIIAVFKAYFDYNKIKKEWYE
jgi:hypothetical protein